MADNFTVNQINGVFGKFRPALDDAISGGDFSADNINGVFGSFISCLDEAAGAAAPSTVLKDLLGVGIIPFSR